jgi:hypothetical protein
MSVKVLHRRSKLSPTHQISLIPNLQETSPISFAERFGSYFPHRKSASGEPLSIAQRIAEFIHFKKPNIDLGSMYPLLQKLKVPGLVLVGIAFISGLAYMAYKLYKNWSEKKANETVDKIMKDFTDSTPELLHLPGWYDQVKNAVSEAVYSKNDTYMVEQITKIKTSIVEKQQSMGHPIGSGIDFFGKCRGCSKTGGGIVMPI